jgi:hypothetical protein
MSKADAAERAVMELRTQANSMERQYGKVSFKDKLSQVARHLRAGLTRITRICDVAANAGH